MAEPMSVSETLSSGRGRGRPRTEHPLSNAERQRRYRERQKNAEKPENPQTLQRITQLQERIDRLESRQLEQFSRIEKRQNELEHRLKSLQTLLTKLVQRLDITPTGSNSATSSRLSGAKTGARRKVDPVAAFAEESRQMAAQGSSVMEILADTSTEVITPAATGKTESGIRPVAYHLQAAGRCQIATGRDGGQCSGKMSHKVTLALADGAKGEFGVCQIHFRQALQGRTLAPCVQEDPQTSRIEPSRSDSK